MIKTLVDRQCQEIDIEQIVELNMIVDNGDPLGQNKVTTR